MKQKLIKRITEEESKGKTILDYEYLIDESMMFVFTDLTFLLIKTIYAYHMDDPPILTTTHTLDEIGHDVLQKWEFPNYKIKA